MTKPHSRARRFAFLVSLALVTCLPLLAQVAKSQARSIKQIFDEDQQDRANFMKLSPDDLQKMILRDASRRKEVRQLLASGSIQTAEDCKKASFVFQHGDKPEDFLLAHILALAAVAKGDATATWISAATLDRYLQSIKQPQVFGTQYSVKDTTAVPRVVTQDPYDNTVVSDALRKVFCVVPYDVQRQNVEAMNKGRNPQPDSCH
jgi:hypothetical protein